MGKISPSNAITIMLIYTMVANSSIGQYWNLVSLLGTRRAGDVKEEESEGVSFPSSLLGGGCGLGTGLGL